MEIDEIQTFLTIAELGGFTRAAQRLHRSQPAISRRLGILEQELGEVRAILAGNAGDKRNRSGIHAMTHA